jgi:hypothetical protein
MPNIRDVLRNILLVLSFATAALADDSAGIHGRLMDPNGKVITGTGASVYATNTAGGAPIKTAVLVDGSYSFTGLTAGTYDLAIPLPCCMYSPFRRQGVVVKPGQTLQLDLPIGWGINLGTIGDDPVTLTNDMRARAKVPQGPAPRTPDGKPDISGVWATIPEPTRGMPPPLQPWAAEIARQRAESNRKDAPGNFCLPNAPIQLLIPFHYRFVQTPKLIVMMQEFDTPGYRQIYMDGRSHPEDWNPAWYGHSIGKWEGDTLVVDTVGFNDRGWLGVAPQTEKLHVTERIRRPDYGHLEAEITAEDPGAFTAPWKITIHAGLLPDEDILEFVCENNKPQHMVGK